MNQEYDSAAFKRIKIGKIYFDYDHDSDFIFHSGGISIPTLNLAEWKNKNAVVK